jgi:D-lyxose ketol-isomerase
MIKSISSPQLSVDAGTARNFRRSLVNRAVAEAAEVLAALRIRLPAYALWTPAQWEAAGAETSEIRDCMLGWDVTDFGSNRYEELGRTLFTLRNGRSGDKTYAKTYAEKLLIEAAGQRSPMHHHRSKCEDIINRAGGNIIIVLHPVSEDGSPGQGKLDVSIDGIRKRVSAGESIRLWPGESLTIAPRTFHQFWAEEGTGVPVNGICYTVSSEVSSVCDDLNDNVFVDRWADRFPTIVEDEPRTCYLCHEYPALAGNGA